MIIPFDQVSKETLNSIIESYVLTEGTDYGEQEKSLADKVEDVRALLKSGKVVLVYSELHETVNILPAGQFEDNQYENGENESF